MLGFSVNGTGLPDVDFDIGVSLISQLSPVLLTRLGILCWSSPNFKYHQPSGALFLVLPFSEPCCRE
jgi:hypothetical protein